MITAERGREIAQEVISRRGYIVGTTSERWPIGEVVKWSYLPDQNFYVFAITDAADMVEQENLIRQLVGSYTMCAIHEQYFYRIQTD